MRRRIRNIFPKLGRISAWRSRASSNERPVVGPCARVCVTGRSSQVCDEGADGGLSPQFAVWHDEPTVAVLKRVGALTGDETADGALLRHDDCAAALRRCLDPHIIAVVVGSASH